MSHHNCSTWGHQAIQQLVHDKPKVGGCWVKQGEKGGVCLLYKRCPGAEGGRDHSPGQGQMTWISLIIGCVCEVDVIIVLHYVTLRCDWQEPHVWDRRLTWCDGLSRMHHMEIHSYLV